MLRKVDITYWGGVWGVIFFRGIMLQFKLFLGGGGLGKVIGYFFINVHILGRSNTYLLPFAARAISLPDKGDE